MELAGQYAQALTGYASALDKWPFDLAAMMGKANSLYALDRLGEAENTLRQTVKMHPDSGPALNNLAQVLLEQDKIKAAHQAINKALELGGPYTETFQETRTDILNRAKK
ncbi:MAG: tetratricopeptide repeat protein [Desulfovermiculus sp.]